MLDSNEQMQTEMIDLEKLPDELQVPGEEIIKPSTNEEQNKQVKTSQRENKQRMKREQQMEMLNEID